jgi:hypothetical protein
MRLHQRLDVGATRMTHQVIQEWLMRVDRVHDGAERLGKHDRLPAGATARIDDGSELLPRKKP